mgnify:CR=1 FL=1
MGTRDAARRGQLRALCTHDANNVMLCYVMFRQIHMKTENRNVSRAEKSRGGLGV